MALIEHRYATAWPLVWALTSALVVLAGLQIESGGFLAALYLGLNACTVLYVLLGCRSIRDRTTLIIGWCAAVQLPVMLWLVTNRNGAPERLTSARHADRARAGAEVGTEDVSRDDRES